ncbi:hypothetical protein GGI10_002689 [Coemansia sp. RSA 2530]|uniref:Uncharacterized protein n=1 Tax=Coemansia linderi TaxID=2663919 RepID=A0ACC1JNV3_9FUNG|nr:hypothetical protein GGI06_000069 [Coemansia sp. S85]KAJ2413983.1 hypothetical protein GGI10_002689 [Coemansia sp. RSA 2530]KAJ2764385.1 hypothetical protein GGI18_006458 [Coemansia linderi]
MDLRSISVIKVVDSSELKSVLVEVDELSTAAQVVEAILEQVKWDKKPKNLHAYTESPADNQNAEELNSCNVEDVIARGGPVFVKDLGNSI